MGEERILGVFFFFWCGLSQQTIYSLTSAYRRSKRILVRPVQLDILCIDANIFRRVHWENRYISRPHQRLLPRIQVLVSDSFTQNSKYYLLECTVFCLPLHQGTSYHLSAIDLLDYCIVLTTWKHNIFWG